jgi:AraC family transcriptional regulator
MISEIGEALSVQENGAAPTILASGCAPGESGLSFVSLRYEGGAHFVATPRQHLVSFISKAHINCKLGTQVLRHWSHCGTMAICPAGVDTSAYTQQDLDSVLIAVEPDKLALAAAQEGVLGIQLIGRLSGDDQTLFELALALVKESRERYPRGTVFWNETAGRFIQTLAAHHAPGARTAANGVFDVAMLMRLRDFIDRHLEEPLDVATLAKMTGRSQFHFSRVFTQSVGVSPYRYVVHLRLQRAVELVRDGRLSLADIAARTGFADQSHLSRWVRRVHGVSLTELQPRRTAA